MNTDNKEELLEYLFQKISETYDPNSWGDCNEINATLGKFLKNNGWEVTCVAGYVLVDHPLDAIDEELSDGIFDPRHMWLKMNNQILDFASNQFKDHIDNFISKNYLLGNCDSYNEMETLNIDNEFVNKSILQELTDDLILQNLVSVKT